MKSIIYIVFILLITSCNYDNNKPESEKSFKFQTIYKGNEVTCFLVFNIEDILVEKNCINENNEKHGPFFTYHENGSTHIMHFYEHGKLNGLQYGFRKDGTRKYSMTMWKGKKNGKGIFYHSNGNVRAYNHYIDDRTIYIVNYNKDRQVIKEEGRLITPIAFTNEIDSLKYLGKYEAHIYFVDPPHGSPNIGIYTTNKEGDTVYKDVPELDTTYHKFNFSTDIPGEYNFHFSIKINTEDSNAAKEYTAESIREILWDSSNTP